MAINETSVDGKKYRQKTATGWKWYSFITKAKDILFGDGEDADNNLETNLGSFKGITTSTNVTETGYAADATVVSDLNRSLGGLQFGIDENGNYGYIKDGADTVTPFKSGFSGSYNANTYHAPWDESSAQVFTIDVSNFKTLTINITSISKCYFLIQKDGVSQPATTSTGTITYDVSDCNTASILYYRNASSGYPSVNYTYTVS